jgi:hypothetical protein
MRANPAALERGLDNQKVDETRLLAKNKTHNVITITCDVSKCRFLNVLTDRLRCGFSEQIRYRVGGPARQGLVGQSPSPER